MKLFPWARIRRDYTPEVAGYYILFEGLLGVVDGTLQENTYAKAKSEGEKKNGIAYDATSTGGWAGITDKYWLTALIPDQSVASTVNFRHIAENGDHYQVDYVTQEPQTVAPAARRRWPSHAVHRRQGRVAAASRTRSGSAIPQFRLCGGLGIFLVPDAADLLRDRLAELGLLGNFGLAIMVFTVFAKALFFPLANYSYRSMSKMKLLAPKMRHCANGSRTSRSACSRR